MAKDIFRKEALSRLASPDRTDAGIRLVGASGWLILGCFVFAMLAGVAWAFATKAPVKVSGSGILIDQGGLVELASEQGGLLEQVLLAAGDVVEQGQVVARLSRSELRRELVGAEAELADRQERFRQIEASHKARSEREAFADRLRIETLEQTRVALQERAALLSDRAKSLEPLAKRKVVPQIRLIEAQIAVSDVDERILTLDEDLQKIALAAAERESRREIERLEERLAIDEITRKIDRLTARLSEEQVIRSAHRGRVVEIKVNAGDVLAAGGALATLAPADAHRDLLALLYVPPADGKRIEPGMIAQVSPTTVEREVYGHILGEVEAVSPLPATPEGMRRILQNDQLVEQLSLGGAPIEIRVRLTVAETPTGFDWSASDGPVGGVNAGTLLEGRVIVEERPLPDLVIPGLSAAWSGG